MADARTEGERAPGPADPRAAVAAADPPHTRNGVSGALRSVMRAGAPARATARADSAVACPTPGIRGLSTWPEAPARLGGRPAARAQAARPGPEGRLGGGEPDPELRRAVIGQCLTVWDVVDADGSPQVTGT